MHIGLIPFQIQHIEKYVLIKLFSCIVVNVMLSKELGEKGVAIIMSTINSINEQDQQMDFRLIQCGM